MNAIAPTSEERAEKLQGLGCKRKRVEDIRFVQGKGNYVDDLKLPGTLYGDLVRSPHAHARIKSIDVSKAMKVPGVLAVLTAKELKPLALHYMPTLAGDVQAVLAEEKVLFQNQEVAFVVAETREAAADAVDLVEVDYEALPVVIDPFKAMAPDAPVLREDIKDKTDGAHGKRKHYNHIFNWEMGDKGATDAAFERAEVTIKELISYQRVHPSPLETCQCVASFDKVRGELTVWGTFQAPHVIRTVASLISKIPEHKIHVISPDIGGGFGNKVGAYPGYICAIVASIVTGRPVKWVEDRIENLSSTSFARDYHMTAEIAARRDGKVTALRVHVLADHGAFDACADPSKWPAGFFNIVTGSYDFPVAHCEVDGVYTNKAPGGVAYRCSFRVTEAAYCIERAMDILAQKLGMDPAELRMKNLIRREQFPYQSALGWEYDSGDYHAALQKAMDSVGYAKLRAEQKAKQEAFKRGETRELMGIGVSFFTEIVGAGPSKNCDILGIAMFDSAEIRIHPTGSVIARLGTKSQGQGHETTYAQIIASELGLPADDITVEEGNTDTAPYGLGTYGSRSTPVSGAATAMAARKIKAKAQMIAAHLLEVHDDDLEWDVDRFRVKGAPERFKTMKELAWAAYNSVPKGMEMGLEAVNYYDPPNMTYPFGAYICVADVDVDTGAVKIRSFYALDDCGTRINPMIIEGQVHGGLTEAFGIAMGQEIRYDEDGNVLTASFMDYFLPTAVETPKWTTDWTTTPSPHHPIGAKGVGESPNVGGVPRLRQRGQRRVRVPRLDAYPDAARSLANLDGGGQTRTARGLRRGTRPASPEGWLMPLAREDIAKPPRRSRLYRRSRPGDRAVDDGLPQAAAAARRSGRRRQDGSRQGAGGAARRRTDPPAVLRGTGSERGALRVELPAPAARDQGARGRRRIGRTHRGADLFRKVPARTPASGGDPARQGAGAAGRRGRPRRRGIRGVPARAPLRLSGLDPRTRHDLGGDDPARRVDLEQHARALRRAEAALPLSLCRFSRRRARSGDHPRANAGRRRLARRADRPARRGDPQARTCARRRASPRRSTGPRPSPGSPSRICASRPKSCTTP